MMKDPTEWLSNIVGKNLTPSAKLASAVISLVVLVLLIYDAVPLEYRRYSLGLLLIHVVNQMYVTYDEMKIHVCYRCGEQLRPKQVSYEKHSCRKK